jgi:hypothetical protein
MRLSRLPYLLILSVMAAVLFSAVAHADSIDITLISTSQSGVAGTTVTFEAILTNLTSSTVFLNGDSATTSTSFLTLDDNPFMSNAPLSLAAGASSGPFALFSVFIAPGTASGIYSPNLFSILGGADSNAFNPVGNAPFSVSVSPVPEPGTITLLLTGMLGLGAWSRLRLRP